MQTLAPKHEGIHSFPSVASLIKTFIYSEGQSSMCWMFIGLEFNLGEHSPFERQILCRSGIQQLTLMRSAQCIAHDALKIC